MKTNDIIMKKWCFGMGRSKVREEARQNQSGELETHRTYPKYRTIVLMIEEATLKKGKNQWTIKGKQYSSLKGEPKKVTLHLKEKRGAYYIEGQKKPIF